MSDSVTRSRILAISGSLRAQSSNRALLLAAKNVARDLCEIDLFEGLDKLPYFNPDLDREGMELPPSVVELRARIKDASALLISTPEYAHGIPGVLKNALDWLVSGPEMVGKSVGLIYGSAGEASHAQMSLQEILKTMSARVSGRTVLGVMGVRAKVGVGGEITDVALVLSLKTLVSELLMFQDSLETG